MCQVLWMENKLPLPGRWDFAEAVVQPNASDRLAPLW
jgi:hypothetical protein